MSVDASRPWWAISLLNGLVIIVAMFLIVVMALGHLTQGLNVVDITMLVIVLVGLPATIITMIRTRLWANRDGLKRR